MNCMSYSWNMMRSMDSMMRNSRNMMSKRSSVNSMSNRSMVSKRRGMNCMSYSWNMMRSMDSMMMRNWSRDMNSWVSSVDSVGEDWFRERFTILINLGLGEEWIEERISIECIELGSLVTVDCVPGFTSEEMLIKQSSIGTDESSSVRSMSSILTHTVSLTP